MTKEQKFQRNTSEHPRGLIFGLVTSILLHSILFLPGNKYWLRAFVPERQQEAQPIPIDFIEVPPQEKKPPPETSRRAANNSIAGGEAKRDQPVSIPRSVPAAVPKASAPSPTVFPAPKPAKSQPLPRQPEVAASPDLVQTQPKPPKAATAPATTLPLPDQQKIVAALRATPSKPEPRITTTPPAPTQLQTEQQKIIAALRSTQPLPKPPKTVATPTTTRPLPSTPQENLRPPESTSVQIKPKVTPGKPSQAQGSATEGAASLLGGPVSLSSRNLGGDSQATLPNSNRSNRGTPGVDARQDVDFGFYLEQLQQKVRRQWMPQLTQSSWKTVIYFSVRRSGEVSNIQIARPSGHSATDEAALSAVKRAAPFAPLPTEYTQDQINIQFTFNINAYGDLELRRGS